MFKDANKNKVSMNRYEKVRNVNHNNIKNTTIDYMAKILDN